MFWGTILCILAISPQLIYGQTTVSSSALAAATIGVNVGAAGHLFTPENITAKVGDIIEFRFYPLNHSVARSTFGWPCIPAEYTEGQTGFWSGFYPLQTIPSQPVTFRVRVNDTLPIWFYCSAPDACQDGMVGVINGNATQTLAVQKQFAHNATIDLSPGEPFLAEGGGSTTTIGGSVPTSTSSTSPPATTHHVGLSVGAIVGIAIGGVAVVLLAGALIYLCGRQRTIGEILKRENKIIPPPYAYGPDSRVSSPVHKTYADDPRFSTQGPYSAADMENYRTRSPGGFGQGPYWPEMSGSANNSMAGFLPVSPRRTSGLLAQGYGSLGRVDSHTGPHELGS